MRLLFDQNISFRIVDKIAPYIEAKQVRELGLENASDLDIWKYARLNGFAIVTFDADFYDLSNLKGQPPKIIWLRTGNRNTNDLAELLIRKAELIQSFLNDSSFEKMACLEITE